MEQAIDYVHSKPIKLGLLRTKNFFSKMISALSYKETIPEELTESQDLAVKVITKAISHPRSVLLMAPISGTRYIHFDDVFIRMEFNQLTIINGVYSYQITIHPKDADSLVTKFNLKLEQTRKQWEREIVGKTKQSLTTLLTALDQ